MVAAPPGDLYTPFPRGHPIEEGFQSSEEGSDLHSPIIEVPYPPDGTFIGFITLEPLLIHMDTPPKKVRYHLGHLTLPDVTTSLVPPHYDSRYVPDVQIPGPHILETLQAPNSTPVHYDPLHHNTHHAYGLHQHSILDLDSQPARSQLPALSPPSEFNFNIPQTRLSEPQLTVAHVLPPSTSSRATNTMSSTTGDRKQQQITASVKASTSATGSNPGSTRPPRREASTTVIACRQWCASFVHL